jgi:Bax protein
MLVATTLIFSSIKKPVTGLYLAESKSRNRKEFFTSSLMPVITEVKKEIEDSRKKVKTLSSKELKTESEEKFLKEHFEKYRIEEGDYQKLLEVMIFPPPSLILAQASLESAWGTSKLTKQGNNLFGMRSFEQNEPRIKIGKKIYYRKYNSVKDSIKDYVVNISRHSAYQDLRSGIVKGEDSLTLVKYLDKYAENPEYRQKLTSVLNSNNFIQYDI